MSATPSMIVTKKPKIQSRMERRLRAWLRTLLYHLVIAGLGFAMLYPIFWMISSSLKSTSEIWTTVNSLIPTTLHFENYVNGWKGFGGNSFTVFYKNSFIFAGVGTFLTVVSSTIIAYGFGRIKFAGKELWFSLMLMTMMLPNQVLLIPQYVIFNKLGWINTFLPLLVPRLGGGAFFIFMIVQFIRGIPKELDEAAMIDGASKPRTFFSIILPQLTPALVTAAIFSFYWTWEDFMDPLIYLNKPELYTVSLALRAFADETGGSDWGAIFAMLTLSLVPVFLIFVFFQRYLVEGISTTGLKG